MALVLKDRVKETTTTTGTGTVTLAGAAFGFQAFSVVGNGNTTYYAIVDATTGDWEVGIGTYTASGTTLSRTTVLSSSNGGALVAFSANIKDVFCTYPASQSANINAALTSGRVTFATTDGLLTDSANLTFNGTTLSAAGLSDSGNLTFTGTGNRITGDFSNATIANRVAFQTSTVNGATQVRAIPNGTGTSATLQVGNSNDPNNQSVLSIGVSATLADINSFSNGTGTYLPIIFSTGGSERVRIDTAGNVGLGVTPAAWTTFTTSRAFQFGRSGSLFYSTDLAQSVLGNNYYQTGPFALFYLSTGGSAQRYVQSDADGSHSWHIAPVGTQDAAVVFTQAMTLTAAGNLGVGTTSPTAPLDVNGNLAITGSARRIIGDFSNATVANRVAFRTSTLNGNTFINALPNGTAASSRFRAFNAEDPTNAAFADFGISGAATIIQSSFGGTGSYLPMSFFTGGSERVSIDTAGNVGIGTSSPLERLHVAGGPALVTGTLASLRASSTSIDFSGGAGRMIATGSDASTVAPVIFGNATTTTYTERMRIDSSGNVGIGTSSPTNAAGYGALTLNGTTGSFLALRTNGTDTAYVQTNASSFDLKGVNNVPMVLYTNNTERARIDSSGNVGIGLTNPGHKLQVAGTAFIGGVTSTDATLNVLPGSGTKGKTSFTVYGATFGASWGGGDTGVRTVFRSGASNTGLDAWTTMVYDIDSNQQDAVSWVNRLRINGNTGDVLLGNNGGNLLVGTPTAISGNTQITVVGSGTNRGALQMGRTTAATTGVAGSLVAYNGSNAICGIDWQSNGANDSGYIGTFTYNAGSFAQGPYLNTGGTNWTAASDERLKNVTGEIENALYKVSQIRAVEFTWKADTLNKQNIGFIAQDVQVVLPEVVDTDTNGNLGVRYAEVTALLLAAIKEQQAIITALTARVAALESN